MPITSHVQSAYERQYQQQQGRWREVGAKQKARNIVELAADLKPRKVLEVGAGDGSVLWWLDQSAFAPELYAVEIAESALQLIRQRDIKALRQAVPFDGQTLPFPDNHFDLVVLSHVLEHVEFERQLLREIRRVARQCVIEVPKDYRPNADRRVAHFLGYGHINLYTPTSLRFLLRTEGFRIVRQKVGVYSAETYQMMYGGLKARLLHAFKRTMTALPVRPLRDYFANTITVLAERETDELRIFEG